MPIPVNANRPSSSNSNNNNQGGGNVPPRPTATSRRGGRTRSRSPPVVMMGGSMLATGQPTVGGGGGRMVASPPPSASVPPPGAGGDPGGHGGMSSAAAAAAAAAAKAYASGNLRGWGKPDPASGGAVGGPPQGDPYSHGHLAPGYHGSGPPPPHHGHPPSAGANPHPGGRHPSQPYPYEGRGGGGAGGPSGWPPDDTYNGSRGRPDGSHLGNSNNINPGGPSSSRSSQPYHYDPYSRGGAGPPPSSRGPPPPGGSGGQSAMGPPPPGHPHDHHDGRYGSRHHPSSSSSRRPTYEQPSPRQQQPGGPPSHPHGQGPPQPSASSYHRGYDSRHGPPPSHHSSPHPSSSSHSSSQPQHHSAYPPHEYGGSRYNSGSSGGRGGPLPDHHQSRHHSRHSARQGEGPSRHNDSRHSGMSSTPAPSQVGSHPRSSPAAIGGGSGTSMVIGGPKPIHLPKPLASGTSPTIESPNMSSLPTIPPSSPVLRPSARMSTSIFRDRPSDESSSSHRQSSGTSTKQPPSRGPRSDSDLDKNNAKSGKTETLSENDNSPHNILLSLRTPTTSFEENTEKVKLDDNKRDSAERTKGISRKDGDEDDNATIQRHNSTNIYRRSPPNQASDQLYETLRSNDFLKPNGSIDIAPSFNILNASFDSLTDGPYFTLESTLGQTESFDFKRAESFGGDQPQLLQRNYSAQILAAGSTSGIGYSPVNSFGTTAGGYRRTSSIGGGSIMVVGGGPGDPHAPIDTYGDEGRDRDGNDVDANMFRTYSTGAGPLEDSHLRMSVGSFGYSRSYGEPSSPAGGYYRSTRSPDNTENQVNDTRNNQQGTSPQPLHHSSRQRHHPYGYQGHHGYDSHPPNHHYRSGREPGNGGGVASSNRPPSFYILLRKYRASFKGCTFLLPGLKTAVQEYIANRDDETDESKRAEWDESICNYGDRPGPTTSDSAVARRRIECSICAFGGNVNRDNTPVTPKEKNSARSSIFRDKEGKSLPAVTPSSTEASSKSRSDPSPGRIEYDEKLSKRYYENESRLSWSFEEEPPIEVPEHTSAMPTEPYKEKVEDDDDLDYDDDDDRFEVVDTPTKEEDKEKNSRQDKRTLSETEKKKTQTEGKDKSSDTDVKSEQYCKPVGTEDFDVRSQSPTPSGKSRGTNSSPQSKIKYRCKLCGQPKQNHRCPYQQSLARSIGVIVFPAVNAFIADEPGTIAAPLSEMNNFFDIQKQESQMAGDASVGGASAEVTPDRSSQVGASGGGSVHGGVPASNMVSPDSLRSSNNAGRSSASHQSSYRNGPSSSHHHSSGDIHSSSSTKKRAFGDMNGAGGAPTRSDDGNINHQSDLLFVEPMELKPEQFRVVSQSSAKTLRSADAFKYPGLPLPYDQRKRLSDNLFSLSNEVPKLTDECALVLRDAREKNMWDLAVAELMTQVIIVLHCSSNDYRLEGLRQYLLTLGIAC